MKLNLALQPTATAALQSLDIRVSQMVLCKAF